MNEIQESGAKTHIDETHERGPFMQLYSGTKWHPHDPRVEDVKLVDMRATARICRFGGHSLKAYSVASHQVYVATMLARDGFNPETQFCGLVHDAHEAYFPGDVPAPMKRSNPLNEALGIQLRSVENKAERVVRSYFGCGSSMCWNIVKHYDLRALATERNVLMAPGFEWALDVDPFKTSPVVHNELDSWSVWLARLAEVAEATGRGALAEEARRL